MLAQWHQDAVLELPGPPLDFHEEAALWGAVLLFRAACLASFREIGEEEIAPFLRERTMPDETSPAAHFSADLCLRHWPDLLRMARARSEDDPLVKVMAELAGTFPLSAVGLNFSIVPAGPVFSHPGLCQLFAERALERADREALQLPAIAALVRAKLGAYTAPLGRGLLSSSLVSSSDP